jgi:HSP20 family molecular chaperone IbpA
MTVQNVEVTRTTRGDADKVEQTRDRRVYIPDTDIFERDNTIVVVADMPGVDDKHVDITLENNVLTITGHAEITEPAGLDLLYAEFEPADYRRSFTLTDDIDRDHIKAHMRNGVLRLVLPKAPQAQPRKIAVQASDT